VLSTSALAQSADCRSIADSLERLRCYDAQSAPPAAAPPQVVKPAAPAEDPFITKAKARVKQQLRDPDSARFQKIKIKTVAGKKGICGEVNAKNAMGGMTGFLDFAYDGEYAFIMSFNAGAGNPTSLSPDIWGLSVGSRLTAHDTWCK
jgi:hypothetical protein